jgi:hypothetical protein
MERIQKRWPESKKKKMPLKCESAQLPENLGSGEDLTKNLRNRCPDRFGIKRRVAGSPKVSGWWSLFAWDFARALFGVGPSLF